MQSSTSVFNPILPTLSLAWRNNDLAVFGVVFPQAGGLIDVRDDAPVFDESRDFIINASNDSPLNPGLIISDVRFSDNRRSLHRLPRWRRGDGLATQRRTIGRSRYQARLQLRR